MSAAIIDLDHHREPRRNPDATEPPTAPRGRRTGAAVICFDVVRGRRLADLITERLGHGGPGALAERVVAWTDGEWAEVAQGVGLGDLRPTVRDIARQRILRADPSALADAVARARAVHPSRRPDAGTGRDDGDDQGGPR